MNAENPPTSNPTTPFLSVVIPAYNEEDRIARTLEEVSAYLGSQDYTWEIAVVDDGSTDSTASLVKSFSVAHSGVHLVKVPHGGKGWAVNQGMLWTTGEFRFLCDADLSMPIEQVSRFLPPVVSNFDAAIGSRELPESRRIGEPHHRHTMGRLYNMLVQALAVPGITDTQCGFKCFSRKLVNQIFPLQKVYGFAFDVEVLFLARKKKLRIVQVPIDWHFRSKSKVSPFKDSLPMSMEVFKIRWRHLRGQYKTNLSAINQDSI